MVDHAECNVSAFYERDAGRHMIFLACSRVLMESLQALTGTSCNCWVAAHGLMSVAVNRAAMINNTVIPVITVA